MKKFLDANFLLDSPAAERLFHEYAAAEPILDYHNHLIPSQIANDARFNTIADLWLGGDHYKWRQMRSNGVPETLVTGQKPGYESFLAWARTVSSAVGNPLFHWTHLELQRYFGIDSVLSEKTAPAIWEACNARMKSPEFSVAGLLKMQRVKAVCTTDDPADSLEHHIAYAATKPAAANRALMFPTYRPDKALAVENPAAWNAYLPALAEASGLEINSYARLVEALDRRHQFFHDQGCRLTDHALVVPPARFATDAEAEKLFATLRGGQALSSEQAESLKGSLLREIGFMNHRRGWTMQLHMSAQRNLNGPMFDSIGPDTGYDAIADAPLGSQLALFLNALQQSNRLPRTILYSLNPANNDILGTIMGCFQDGSVPGKVQLGSAWWFNDHIDGMERQLIALANLGLLPRFVGMLTDSRSFLSFPRHEYFRRILCNLLGGWIDRGLWHRARHQFPQCPSLFPPARGVTRAAWPGP
jgi:glucuronate isomerase